MDLTPLSQHDPRWKNQRLGTENGATIGGFGCTITCLTMANRGFNPGDGRLVNNIDDIFTNQGGYVDGKGHRSPYANCDLVDWNKVHELLPNLNLVAVANYPDGVAADVARINQHVDGGGLVVLQVFWKGNKANMHFVLAVGHNGNDILVNDPETGARQYFSSKLFGSGIAAEDIYSAHFFADGVPNTPPPIVPPAPAAAAPSLPTPAAPAPAPAVVTPPEEDQVTQAAHDAIVAELNAAHAIQIQDLSTQLTTVRDQLTKLQALVPEYQASESPQAGEFLTVKAMTLFDFAEKKPPVEVDANLIVDAHSTFIVDGVTYLRSDPSFKNGDWYGYPTASLVPYQPAGPAPLPPTPPAPLTSSQRVLAAAVDGKNLWERIFAKINPFGGKKS